MNFLFKYIIALAFSMTLVNLAHSQSRQTQAILDSWDREIITEIFADTITSDTQYSDTIDIGRWAGSPRRFALFLEIDSVQGMTDEVEFTAVFEPALESTGPFYAPGGTLGDFPLMGTNFISTGRFVFDVRSYGGNFARVSFTCTDTLLLHAILWMKH
jgi:hypothetical protein